MTKKISAILLASALVVSASAFTANAAADENVYYVEAGLTGNGTEEKPFGTIDEAITALEGKDGTIYVYGTYNLAPPTVEWDGMVTVTGASKDSVIQVNDGLGIVFKGPITFKDIQFDIGKYAHFNPNGHKLVMDGGEDSNFGFMMHLSTYANSTVDSAETEVNSGSISTLYLGGGYSTSYANGVMGDTTLTVNGGTVKTINLSADRYMDTHTGISVGGNMNLIYNGGTINAIGFNDGTKPEIMGALNIVFNNGMEAPEKFSYPEESVAGGVYIVKSAVGGMITPTADVGVFEVKADKGKVAKIDGKEVFNGTVELDAGETEVTWVDGEQPETEEKIEIKLTIGDANIVTNGESKALDVPAQLIDNRTMVPLRAIFEALGASVEWNNDTRTVTSVKDDTTVVLTVGENKLTVNGAEKALDVPGQIVDNRTLVPVRAISEAFGCEVGWDADTRTVSITK